MLKSWCFQIVVPEKTLESPLDSKEIKPVNPKEINPEYSLKGLMLKLKLQYFDHLIESWLTGKDTDSRKDWGQEEKGAQRMRWWVASLTQWTCAWANSRRQWRTGKPGMLQSMGLQKVGHSDWTITTMSLHHSKIWSINMRPIVFKFISYNHIFLFCSVSSISLIVWYHD